jgi:hypothetical protein
MIDPILRYFQYEHLPPELASSSKPFADLAKHIVDTIQSSSERTVALRKLLEAKDAAVRAALPPLPGHRPAPIHARWMPPPRKTE